MENYDNCSFDATFRTATVNVVQSKQKHSFCIYLMWCFSMLYFFALSLHYKIPLCFNMFENDARVCDNLICNRIWNEQLVLFTSFCLCLHYPKTYTIQKFSKFLSALSSKSLKSKTLNAEKLRVFFQFSEIYILDSCKQFRNDIASQRKNFLRNFQTVQSTKAAE